MPEVAAELGVSAVPEGALQRAPELAPRTCATLLAEGYVRYYVKWDFTAAAPRGVQGQKGRRRRRHCHRPSLAGDLAPHGPGDFVDLLEQEGDGASIRVRGLREIEGKGVEGGAPGDPPSLGVRGPFQCSTAAGSPPPPTRGPGGRIPSVAPGPPDGRRGSRSRGQGTSRLIASAPRSDDAKPEPAYGRRDGPK